jgi:outer membrane protein OmpA-like peptidoglycan-associated protein
MSHCIREEDGMKRLLLIFLTMTFLLSCARPMTRSEEGAAVGVGVGAATGALLGAAIGGSGRAAAIGAVTGAAAGGIAGAMIGEYMDRQEREFRAARLEGAQIQREQDNLSITFRSDLLFDVNSANLRPPAFDEVSRLAHLLNRYPETRVQISGHTDSTGSEQHNMQLSERRAHSVMDALIDRGVYAGRITAVGYGESRPIASNATERGKQLNRRVHVLLIPIRS